MRCEIWDREKGERKDRRCEIWDRRRLGGGESIPMANVTLRGFCIVFDRNSGKSTVRKNSTQHRCWLFALHTRILFAVVYLYILYSVHCTNTIWGNANFFFVGGSKTSESYPFKDPYFQKNPRIKKFKIIFFGWKMNWVISLLLYTRKKSSLK